MIEIDQTYLETVIPKPGNTVLVLTGPHKHKTGILTSVRLEEGLAIVKI
jgi:hypothetical protein